MTVCQRALFALAIGAAVEAMPSGRLAGRGWERRDPAETGEGVLRAHTLRVVPRRDEQRPGDIGTNTVESTQLGRGSGRETIELGVEGGEFSPKRLMAMRQDLERQLGGRWRRRDRTGPRPAAVSINWSPESERSCSRSSAGAVTMSARI
jgi:hypothetical protein